MLAPCYQCKMVFDDREERDEHVNERHRYRHSKEFRWPEGFKKAISQFMLQDDQKAIQRFNEISGHTELPAEPWVCG